MYKACVLAGLAIICSGCVRPATTWRGSVEWPEEETDSSVKAVAPPMEAGAALAAAGAIRELVRTNTDPGLFWGCSSPEQGLDVAVFTGPTQGLYYVVVEQRFHRCGGPSGRVLDWRHVYAVTPQGEVVAEAPPPRGEVPDSSSSPPSPAPSAPTPAPAPSVPEAEVPSTPAPSAPAPSPTPPGSDPASNDPPTP